VTCDAIAAPSVAARLVPALQQIGPLGCFPQSLELNACFSRSERSNAMFFSPLFVLPFVLVVALYLLAASIRILAGI